MGIFFSTRSDPAPLRLLCVLAHPDDETLAMGGTIACYAARASGVSCTAWLASRFVVSVNQQLLGCVGILLDEPMQYFYLFMTWSTSYLDKKFQCCWSIKS